MVKLTPTEENLCHWKFSCFLYGYVLVYYILGMIITSNVMLYYGKIDIDRRKFMLLEMYMFVCVCVFFIIYYIFQLV